MLKSLEKLRNGGIWGEDCFGFSEHKAQNLADEIQTEVDKYYLPRPLFEDGEPVQVGDYVDLQMEGKRRVQVTDIRPWIVYGSSTSHQNEPYKRPPEPDSQEKIDADYRNETNSLITDSGRGCMTRERALKYVESFDEIMARQRKLDGVE